MSTNAPIARLTPLAEALLLVARDTAPVAVREAVLADALGCVLAEDIRIDAHPAAALALADGWALAAEATSGAGAYAPIPLPQMPIRIETGAPLPPGCDAVAPLETVRIGDGLAEAIAAVGSGEGVLAAGGNAPAHVSLKGAGERLKRTDLAALAALRIATARVRVPRFAFAPARSDAFLIAALRWAADDARARGAEIEFAASLSEALADDSVDAVIGAGGTGAGRNDTSVATLAAAGQIALHGLALSPGETAALGFGAGRPVLLLPGRIDAAAAVWLTLGRPLVDRLAGAEPAEEPAEMLTLSRKVVSTIGLTEIVPVRRRGAEAEPLAAGFLPLSALTCADGYVVVPPESEGSSAGCAVRVWRWP